MGENDVMYQSMKVDDVKSISEYLQIISKFWKS